MNEQRFWNHTQEDVATLMDAVKALLRETLAASEGWELVKDSSGLPCGASERDLITPQVPRPRRRTSVDCPHSGRIRPIADQPAKEVVAFQPSHQSLKFPSPQEADVSATSKLQICMPCQFSAGSGVLLAVPRDENLPLVGMQADGISFSGPNKMMEAAWLRRMRERQRLCRG